MPFLELANRLADRRGRNAQPIRRGREAVGFSNRQERGDAVERIFQIMNLRFSVYVPLQTL